MIIHLISVALVFRGRRLMFLGSMLTHASDTVKVKATIRARNWLCVFSSRVQLGGGPSGRSLAGFLTCLSETL